MSLSRKEAAGIAAGVAAAAVGAWGLWRYLSGPAPLKVRAGATAPTTSATDEDTERKFDILKGRIRSHYDDCSESYQVRE